MSLVTDILICIDWSRGEWDVPLGPFISLNNINNNNYYYYYYIVTPLKQCLSSKHSKLGFSLVEHVFMVSSSLCLSGFRGLTLFLL
jgi:hypothetical protein